MKVGLAYVLVFFLGSIALTIGSLLVGHVVRVGLASVRGGLLISGMLGGIAGVVCAVALAVFVFRWLGVDYGPAAFVVSLVSLAVVYLNDNAKTKTLHAAALELPESIRAVGVAQTDGLAGACVGYLLGGAGAVVWFFVLR